MITRILIALPLVLLGVAMMFLRGWPFAAVLSVFAVAAQYEMHTALRSAGYQTLAWPGVVLSALFAPLYALLGLPGLFFALVLLCVALLVQTLFRPQEAYPGAIASFFTLLYPTCFFMMIYFIVHIADFGSVPQGVDAVLLTSVGMASAALCPAASDTMALFVGIACGRHKIAPRISPKKTVEGAIGGLCGSVLCMVLLYGIMEHCLHTGLPLWQYLLLGVVNGVLAQLGDLCASQLKRYAGIKDFSTVLPGHGGIMDRMDSILFGAAGTWCFLFLLVRL